MAGKEGTVAGKPPTKPSKHGIPNPHVMDLVYNFLNDYGYYKATHGIRLETQKRESARAHSSPASWQGKANQLPALEQLFQEWEARKTSFKLAATAPAKGQTLDNAEDVPLPESEDSSDDASSSGDESDDESSSAVDSDSDDSDESEDDEDEQTEVAVKISNSKSTPTVQTTKTTALKRKRSSPSPSSEESSGSDEEDSSDNSTDESDGEPIAKRTKIAAASSEDDDSEDVSSEEESEEEESVKAANVPLPDSSDESSESESEDEESSSDESNEEAKANMTGSATLQAQAVARGPSDSDTSREGEDSSSDSTDVAESSSSTDSDSDSDSASEAESPVTQPTTNDASSADVSNGSESSETLAHPSPEFQPPPTSADDNMHPSRKRKMDDATATEIAQSKYQKKNNTPFSRIREDTTVDPRFASNAYVPYDYAQRAHEKLIVTKGKGFTKEKNKGKRGSYRGGMIDIQGTKGIKFED